MEWCEFDFCYLGVVCIEMIYGYMCGDCLEGMEGNGIVNGCEFIFVCCEYFLCFDGIICLDISDGY